MGCVNEAAHPELGSDERFLTEGGKPFCIYQLNDPDVIKARILAATEKVRNQRAGKALEANGT